MADGSGSAVSAWTLPRNSHPVPVCAGFPKAMAERNGTISDGSPRAAHTRVPQGTADPDKNCHAAGGATDPFRMTLEWFRLGVNSLY